MKFTTHLGALALAGLLAACGAQKPPSQLQQARASYMKASESEAARLAPGELHTARQALKEAEMEFTEQGDTTRTRDLAYIADRKARRAEARGEIQAAQNEKLAAEQELAELRSRLSARARTEAEMSREALMAERQRREQAEQETEQAEEKAEQAMKRLQAREEERGTVLTLSGSVLFPSGQSELLPGARERLNEVARALKQYEDRDFLVEGHTDSVGSAESNMILSRQRAQSVVEYLVSRGVPRERLHARGLGESRPVAPNDSPANRANNRRVEIIVSPERGGMTMRL